MKLKKRVRNAAWACSTRKCVIIATGDATKKKVKMKLLFKKYRKLCAWLRWRDIRLIDVLIGTAAAGALIAVVVTIIGSL